MISVLNFDSNVSIISITFNAVQETKILSTSVKSIEEIVCIKLS